MVRLVTRTEELNGSGFRCTVQYAGRNGYRNINIEKTFLRVNHYSIFYFIFNSPKFFFTVYFFFFFFLREFSFFSFFFF